MFYTMLYESASSSFFCDVRTAEPSAHSVALLTSTLHNVFGDAKPTCTGKKAKKYYDWAASYEMNDLHRRGVDGVRVVMYAVCAVDAPCLSPLAHSCREKKTRTTAAEKKKSKCHG